MTSSTKRQPVTLQLTPEKAPTPSERARATQSARKPSTKPRRKSASQGQVSERRPTLPAVTEPPREDSGGSVPDDRVDAKSSPTSAPVPSPVFMGDRPLRVNLNVRVLPHMKEMLDEICHRERKTQQQFVEEALNALFAKRRLTYEVLFPNRT